MSELPPLSKLEDLAAVPLTEPVLVDLGIPDDDKPVIVEDKKLVAAKKADSDAKSLQGQLEALKAANATENQRLQRERDEERRGRQAAEADARQAREQQTLVEHDAIVNSLQGAQSERDAAQLSWQNAYDAGNSGELAKAQSRLARAEAKILHYETEQATFEQAVKSPRQESAQQPRQPRQIDIMSRIDAMTDLLQPERDWLKSHPEAIMDARRSQELDVAYDRAMRAGLARGSEAYFKHLNEFMGYEKPAAVTTEGTAAVSAPVSRDNSTPGPGRALNGRVHLSSEQRELASSMGLTDVQYAAQVMRLHADKQADPEKYQRRS